MLPGNTHVSAVDKPDTVAGAAVIEVRVAVKEFWVLGVREVGVAALERDNWTVLVWLGMVLVFWLEVEVKGVVEVIVETTSEVYTQYKSFKIWTSGMGEPVPSTREKTLD